MDEKEIEYHKGNLLEKARESAEATEDPAPEVDYSNPPEEKPVPVYYATVEEFADLIGVKPNTVEQRIYRGTLKSRKIGTKQRIPVTEALKTRTPIHKTGKKINKLVSMSVDLADILFVPTINASRTLNAGGWIMAYVLNLCSFEVVENALIQTYGRMAGTVLQRLRDMVDENEAD